MDEDDMDSTHLYSVVEAENIIRRLVMADEMAHTFRLKKIRKPILDSIKRVTSSTTSCMNKVDKMIHLQMLDTYIRKLFTKFNRIFERQQQQDRNLTTVIIYSDDNEQQEYELNNIREVLITTKTIVKMNVKYFEHFSSLCKLLLQVYIYSIAISLFKRDPDDINVSTVYRMRVNEIRNLTSSCNWSPDSQDLRETYIKSFRKIAIALTNNKSNLAKKLLSQFVKQYSISKLSNRIVKVSQVLRSKLGPLPAFSIAPSSSLNHVPSGDEAFEEGKAGNIDEREEEEDDDGDSEVQPVHQNTKQKSSKTHLKSNGRVHHSKHIVKRAKHKSRPIFSDVENENTEEDDEDRENDSDDFIDEINGDENDVKIDSLTLQALNELDEDQFESEVTKRTKQENIAITAGDENGVRDPEADDDDEDAEPKEEETDEDENENDVEEEDEEKGNSDVEVENEDVNEIRPQGNQILSRSKQRRKGAKQGTEEECRQMSRTPERMKRRRTPNGKSASNRSTPRKSPARSNLSNKSRRTSKRVAEIESDRDDGYDEEDDDDDSAEDEENDEQIEIESKRGTLKHVRKKQRVRSLSTSPKSPRNRTPPQREDHDEDEDEDEDEDMGEEDEIVPANNNSRSSKSKRRADRRKSYVVMNELRDELKSLKSTSVEDPLPSALRKTSRVRRRGLTSDLDRPGAGARNASPIPDSEDENEENSSVRKRPQANTIRARSRTVNLLEDDSGEDSDMVFRNTDREEINGKLVKKGKFKPHEDQWLIQGLEKYGWGSWAIISKDFGDGTSKYTRTAMSLKDRARTLDLDPNEYVIPAGRLERRGRPPTRHLDSDHSQYEVENDPIEDEDSDKDKDESENEQEENKRKKQKTNTRQNNEERTEEGNEETNEQDIQQNGARRKAFRSKKIRKKTRIV